MLQKHSFTLDVHLWEIFNYPCNISWAESWHHTQEKPEDADDHRWIYLLKKYAQQKVRQNTGFKRKPSCCQSRIQ